jgi:hypothetical protein
MPGLGRLASLARIIAELVLILFCISEHLGAIRNQQTTLSGEE